MKIVQVSVGSVKMPPKEGNAPLQVIFNTSRQLANMGHEVIILDRKYSKNDPDVEPIEGVEIVRLKAMQARLGKAPRLIRFAVAELNAALFALAVARYLRKNKSNVDIVHFHLTSIGLMVSLLNRGLRKRMLYTCHLGEWQLATERLSLVERIHLLLDPYLMRRVRRVIALNDAARERFVSIGKVKAEAIVVLPNGVDTDFFAPDAEAAEGAQREYGLVGRLTVLFVGRLARIKGVEYLLRAADTVINEFGCRNACFVLVGSPGFDATEKPISMEEATNFIGERHLQDYVRLTGPLPMDEVRTLYAAADVFVLPSLAEGDPLVTLEAMASGKPVIGTRVGAIPHHIRDGWNGFIVEPGHERQLAERIKRLLDNADERRMMGANSRKYAEEELDWKRVAEKLALVYQGD